jgi:hypothetical protein
MQLVETNSAKELFNRLQKAGRIRLKDCDRSPAELLVYTNQAKVIRVADQQGGISFYLAIAY